MASPSATSRSAGSGNAISLAVSLILHCSVLLLLLDLSRGSGPGPEPHVSLFIETNPSPDRSRDALLERLEKSSEQQELPVRETRIETEEEPEPLPQDLTDSFPEPEEDAAPPVVLLPETGDPFDMESDWMLPQKSPVQARKPGPALDSRKTVKAQSPEAYPSSPASGTDDPASSKARLLELPAPDYPEPSRRRGEEGKVVFQVTVQPDGRVDEIVMLEGSPFEGLNQAALGAVHKARFAPASVNGTPVAARVRIPFRFELN